MGAERQIEMNDDMFALPQTAKFDTREANASAVASGEMNDDMFDIGGASGPLTTGVQHNVFLEDVSREVKSYTDYYAAQTRTGMRGVIQGWGGMQAIIGAISDEDMMNVYGSPEIEAADQELIDTFEKKVGAANILSWIGPALQSLPQMAASAGGHLAGEAVGSGVGAIADATGKTKGASTLLREFGGKTGMFTISAGLMAGQFYRDAIEKDPNVDRAVAKRVALATGAAQAAIEVLQLRQLGGLARRSIATVGKSEASAIAFETVYMDFLKTVLTQGAEEVLQDVNIAEIGNYLLGKFGKSEALVPTWDQVIPKTVKTFTEAVKAGAVFAGASSAMRKRKSLTTSEYKKLIDAMYDQDDELNENEAEKTPEEKAATAYDRLFDRAEAQDKAERRQEKQKEDSEQTIKETLAGINEKRAVDQGTHGQEPTKAQKALRSLGGNVFSWEGKLRIIFQDMKDPSALVKKLGGYETAQQEVTGRRKALKRLRQFIQKATGLSDKETVKLMVQGAVDRVSFTDSDGRKVDMSANEAIKLHNQMLDTTLKKGIKDKKKGNGFTLKGDVAENQSTQERIEQSLNALDPNYLKAAEGLKEFYKDQYTSLAAAYKEETGKDLPQNNEYSGFAQRRGFSLDGKEDQFTAMFTGKLFSADGGHVKDPSTLIDRQDSNLALEKQDAFLDAMRQTAITEHWKAWRTRKELAAVFSDPQVRSNIEKKYGKRMMNAIDAHLSDIMNTNLTKIDSWTDLANDILKNAGTAFLGLKPLQFLKQATGWFNLGLHVDEDALVKYSVEFWANPVKNAKMIMSSNWYKNRYENYDSTVSGIITDADVNNLDRANLKDKLLFFLKAGDKAVAVVGGYAAYRHFKDNKGMSDKQAMVEAGRAIETTQSSGLSTELSNAARNPYLRPLTIFLQAPTRLAEFRLQSWREAVNTGKYLQALKVEYYTHLAQAAFAAVGAIAILNSAGDDDDKKQDALWTFYTEAINGPLFPVMNDLLRSGEAIGTNIAIEETEAEFSKQRIFDMKTIPLEALNKTKDFAKHLYDAKKEVAETGSASTETILKLALDYARSINLILPKAGGLPLEPPLKEIKRITQEQESE